MVGKSRSIVGGSPQFGHCAVTRSSKDGCFRAYLLAVLEEKLPFSLDHREGP